MRNITLLVAICCILLSCSGSSSSTKDEFTLIEKITFPMDEKTYYFSRTISSFVDNESGKEYFSFENIDKGQNEILFFDMESHQLVKRIEIQREGVNAVAGMYGHHVKDLQHIFITSSGRKTISLVDDKATLIKSFDYAQSDLGEPLSLYCPVSIFHTALTVRNDTIYIPQSMIKSEMSGSDWSSIPLCAIIDIKNKKIKNLPLKYPILFKTKSEITSGIDIGYSFEYDEKNFIYSFMKSDSIIVTTDHISSRSYLVRSRFLDKVECIPNPGNDILTSQRRVCEQDMYWHFMYDKYRNVYYRFAFSACDITAKDDPMLISLVRQEFSVMVLDKDFNVIKEVRFPNNKYSPKMCFIGKKGLYISENNPFNPEFDENKLVFSCFN